MMNVVKVLKKAINATYYELEKTCRVTEDESFDKDLVTLIYTFDQEIFCRNLHRVMLMEYKREADRNGNFADVLKAFDKKERDGI